MNENTGAATYRNGYQVQPSGVIAGSPALYVSMDVEVDDVTFNVSSKNDLTLVSFDRLRDTYRTLKTIRRLVASSGIKVSMLEDKLQQMGITLCLQYRCFGVMGPGSNTILRRIFNFTVFPK